MTVRKSGTFVVYSMVWLLLSVYASAYEHPGGLHSSAQLTLVRQKVAAGQAPYGAAYTQLRSLAGNLLSREPQAVADFDVPPYYDDPDAWSVAADPLKEDALAAYSCALVYALGQESNSATYAEQARKILNAWASINTTVSGGDGPLVMSYAGVGLVFAAELLSGYGGWTAAEQEQCRTWVQQVFRSEANSIISRTNNWGDWAVLGSMAASHYLDDVTALVEKQQVLKDKIDDGISSDGHMPRETSREANGIWYTYFALAPMTAACQVAFNATGTDLFNYVPSDGGSIKKALDHLFYYSQNPDEWPYYTESDLRPSTPGNWAGNLFEAMSVIYDESAWEDWIASSRPIKVAGHHYAWTFPTLLRPLALNSTPDETGPELVRVTAGISGSEVSVLFNEAVDAATAATTGNYGIDNGVSVLSATLGADLQTVTLVTSTMTEGVTYTITVSGVKDLADPANTMSTGQETFIYSMCVTSTSSWRNFGMDEQTGAFEATYAATPLAATCDGLVMFSKGDAAAYSDCAILVRFNQEGKLDVRNGGAYQADQDISYGADTEYHFRVTADVSDHTYSVYVTPAGGSETALASGYAFRSEQSGVTSLDTWSIIDNTGSFRVCDMSVHTGIGISRFPPGMTTSDMRGRLSETERMISLDGRSSINGSSLRPGVYIVETVNGPNREYRKMLVIE